MNHTTSPTTLQIVLPEDATAEQVNLAAHTNYELDLVDRELVVEAERLRKAAESVLEDLAEGRRINELGIARHNQTDRVIAKRQALIDSAKRMAKALGGELRFLTEAELAA